MGPQEKEKVGTKGKMSGVEGGEYSIGGVIVTLINTPNPKQDRFRQIITVIKVLSEIEIVAAI